MQIGVHDLTFWGYKSEILICPQKTLKTEKQRYVIMSNKPRVSESSASIQQQWIERATTVEAAAFHIRKILKSATALMYFVYLLRGTIPIDYSLRLFFPFGLSRNPPTLLIVT